MTQLEILGDLINLKEDLSPPHLQPCHTSLGGRKQNTEKGQLICFPRKTRVLEVLGNYWLLSRMEILQ